MSSPGIRLHMEYYWWHETVYYHRQRTTYRLRELVHCVYIKASDVCYKCEMRRAYRGLSLRPIFGYFYVDVSSVYMWDRLSARSLQRWLDGVYR